ncbi:transposase [uncultured Arthrobacter sp.]|uniref:transposase n=1 Tax=uncultured Arthrobacter sp. TaxID=114050 RepID=UPI0032173699
MVPQDSLLVILVGLIDLIPEPPEPARRKRGRPKTYSERLFLKALVVMIIQQVHTPSGLLAILAQPTAEMQVLRRELSLPDGRLACRRTWERRLAAVPGSLPAQIACLGCFLLALLGVWAKNACAAAIDSTVLIARGGVWHKKDREKGEVPHTSIDTEAHWTKSGWHGWVYGWKLHLVVTAACHVWLPLAAEVTPANVADNEQAPTLIESLPPGLHFLLGDQHYHDEALVRQCQRRGCTLVTSFTGKNNPYPHHDDGAKVRQILHKTRSIAIENFNEHFKAIFDVHGAVPTKGLLATQRFVLSAVFVYQLAILYCFLLDLDLRLGLKALLKAA